MSPVTRVLEPSRSSIQVEYPPKGEIRVRRLVSRSAPRPITKYPSVRLGRSVHCESSLEADLAELFDACAQVSKFGEQPVLIRYEMAGASHWHVPDFLAQAKHGKAFIEVKFAKDVTPEVMARTDFLKAALRSDGYEYYLLTERQIHRDSYLENARFLLRRSRYPVAKHREMELFSQIRTAQMLPLSVFMAGDDLVHISKMILDGVLSVPMAVPLAPATPVTIAKKGEGQPWVWALFN